MEEEDCFAANKQKDLVDTGTREAAGVFKALWRKGGVEVRKAKYVFIIEVVDVT